MGRNIEQKFRCADLAAAVRRALVGGAEDRGLLFQHDLFFGAPQARLKLRLALRSPEDDGLGQPAELISYVRPDGVTARASAYHLAPIADPATLITVLTQALGPPKSLRKTRQLLIHGQTRIHADCVHSLNEATFVELETVVTTQSLAEAQRELAQVVALLDLREVVPTAYVDLVEG